MPCCPKFRPNKGNFPKPIYPINNIIWTKLEMNGFVKNGQLNHFRFRQKENFPFFWYNFMQSNLAD